MLEKAKKAVSAGILGVMLATFPGPGAVAWAVENAAPALLKQGMSGEDIVKLQTELAKHGHYQGVVDGKFGYRTKSAVINFQLDCGLLADGVVGEQTWQALRNYPANSVSRGAPASRNAHQIVNFAQKFLGTAYVWGGVNPGGFDCSGFIFYIFQQHGVTLPRMADGQFYAGYKVPSSDLRAGDIVFFTTYEPGPSHAGIYLGNGSFIHASSAAGQVVITPMSKPYYRERYLGARRFIH